MTVVIVSQQMLCMRGLIIFMFFVSPRVPISVLVDWIVPSGAREYGGTVMLFEDQVFVSSSRKTWIFNTDYGIVLTLKVKPH